jgi:A/G-specific adenine glycosylase
VFPSEQALADASLADVLKLWQGLGYNRRAKFLHEAAKQVVELGSFPDSKEALMKLPGVGLNTAGAILAYSFNKPVIFVETNIRTVYFHHFFQTGDKVDDKQIIERMEQTTDTEHPREWYWALMDYGSWLKRQGYGRVQLSKHYAKQAPLKASVREVRGQIVKALVGDEMTKQQLSTKIKADERFESALVGLLHDGLIAKSGIKLHLTK